MCTSGDDPRDDSSPFLFGAAEEEESRRELEAKQKADERRCFWCDNDGTECLCDDKGSDQ